MSPASAVWHAQYLALEIAASAASERLHTARRALNRKRPPVNAQAEYDAALAASRIAGKARWDFEMAATVIVDVATLPTKQWAASLVGARA